MILLLLSCSVLVISSGDNVAANILPPQCFVGTHEETEVSSFDTGPFTHNHETEGLEIKTPYEINKEISDPKISIDEESSAAVNKEISDPKTLKHEESSAADGLHNDSRSTENSNQGESGRTEISNHDEISSTDVLKNEKKIGSWTVNDDGKHLSKREISEKIDEDSDGDSDDDGGDSKIENHEKEDEDKDDENDETPSSRVFLSDEAIKFILAILRNYQVQNQPVDGASLLNIFYNSSGVTNTASTNPPNGTVESSPSTGSPENQTTSGVSGDTSTLTQVQPLTEPATDQGAEPVVSKETPAVEDIEPSG